MSFSILLGLHIWQRPTSFERPNLSLPSLTRQALSLPSTSRIAWKKLPTLTRKITFCKIKRTRRNSESPCSWPWSERKRTDTNCLLVGPSFAWRTLRVALTLSKPLLKLTAAPACNTQVGRESWCHLGERKANQLTTHSTKFCSSATPTRLTPNCGQDFSRWPREVARYLR